MEINSSQLYQYLLIIIEVLTPNILPISPFHLKPKHNFCKNINGPNDAKCQKISN